MADRPLSLRMSAAERAALDACRGELSKATGLPVSRSGFVRYALAAVADQFGRPWPTSLYDTKEPR